jgi:hypothetical protein
MIFPRILVLFLLCAFGATAATLNIPPRATNALSGQQFVKAITAMAAPPDTQRENWIYAQIASGNVPDFMRTLIPITTNLTISGTAHTVTYYVTPDYMAIGSDSDYFLTPMTPLLAQRLDNLLGTIRPTRKMVDQIANRAVVHLQPNPIPPDPNMITVPYFNQHNTMVWTQRVVTLAAHPLGSLVDGDKKDVIIAPKIYTNFSNANITKPVVIYGWHYPDGTFIQPEYNGHEETYADYSHGIRMVQNAIIFDGTNTTISAVLTNPAIAAVLSDETTYTGNVIQKPYYTVAAVAPTIITHPASRAVGPGTNVQFSVLSVGDQTLTYTWKLNGTAISGATNSVLTINNAQASNAGTYTVVVANSSGTATSWNATLTVEPNRTKLFADDFDTDSSANWNIFAGSDNANLDYSVTWAYDYGATAYTSAGLTRLIPPAPHSAGSTKGVKLTVNTTNGANTGVNIYPKNKTFSGNFALKFDMWINYPGGVNGAGATGSTQHGIFGINHTGTRVNWAAASASVTDGLWFACDGDGGTSRDYRAYRGNTSGTQTELIGTAASGLTFSNHAATVYQNTFRVPPYESAGSPGKGWVSVEVDQTNNNLVVLMNGTIIAQRANTSAFTNGTIMLGLMDVFPSLASPVADSYIIFDNVTVEDLNTATATPAQFQDIAINRDNTLNMTWTITPSATYTLQYKTNLNDATWTVLGTYNSPTPTLSFTNVPLLDPQAFYQLVISQ